MSDTPETDLSAETFLILRDHFFHPDGGPAPFQLRDKRNTQDDPLDEYIAKLLDAEFRDGVKLAKANGPLITPDLVAYRPASCERASKQELRASPSSILGIEIKKLERQTSGKIARASGLDYNTTPPCGTVRIYDHNHAALDIKGCYLFVCQESVPKKRKTYQLTALALCDGNLLNEDFSYYLSVIGPRSKEIELGTYRDGANRMRPMVVFPNPLGASALDHQATLIHSRDDVDLEEPNLQKAGIIERTVPDEKSPGNRTFYCYRSSRDCGPNSGLFRERDPFPTSKHSAGTVMRGRFVLRLPETDRR